MALTVAMMQPSFLPWLGYFELIRNADVFIFLDDFQFVYQSFECRNRLFVSKNVVGWLTVPVDKKNDFLKPINGISIREDLKWRNKMWRGIENNYGKTSYFATYVDTIKPLLVEPQFNLAKQNIGLISAICNILELKPKFLYSSQMPIEGKRSERVKNLLNAVGATKYLSAHGSFGYMFEDGVFPLPNIEVLFQNANLVHSTRKQSGLRAVSFDFGCLVQCRSRNDSRINFVDNGTLVELE